MTRSTDLAALSRVGEHRQGPLAGTPNLWMNPEKGAFADWWLHIVPNSDSSSK
jgi:hypothetical protein